MALPNIDNFFTLTGDPEMRFTPNGAGVCSFNVAANKPKFENGQPVKDERGYTVNDRTLYLPCVAFGQLGEMIAEQAGRGSSVRLVGALETQQWEDKNTGEKRSKTQLVVDLARVVPRRNQNGNQGNGGGYQQGGYTGGPAQGGGWGNNPNQGQPNGGSVQGNYQGGGQADPWAASQTSFNDSGETPPF